MKSITAPCCVCILSIVSFACSAPAEKSDLADRFRLIVKEQFPSADVVEKSGGFAAKYDTMTYTVHGHRAKYRGFHEQTHQQEGPDFQGFILSLKVRPGPFETQASTIRPGYFQATMREPYWKTFAARLPTPDGESHYVIDFSFGSGVDDGFKKQVLELLSEYGGPRQANPVPCP